MKYTVDGKEIQLTQKEFIADGGEADVYGIYHHTSHKDYLGTAYKIYKDLSKVLTYQKFQELSVLSHPNIVKPEHSILKKEQVVGYTMNLIQGYGLCQLFTKSFKQRNGLTEDKILDLTKKFKDIISFIHSKGILVVDLNEFNFLVNNSFDELYAIDVNSYQTPSFPATVILPSVYDHHCHNKFNENTDWFSWAVLITQLFIGIHPYKGTYADFDGMTMADKLNARMDKNISCFNKKVSLPKMCASFDVIPPNLRNWLFAVLEEGKRLPPPNDFENIVINLIKQIKGSNLFNVVKLEEFPQNITGYHYFDGCRCTSTKDFVFYKNQKYNLPTKEKCEFIFLPKENKLLAVYLENKLCFHDFSNSKKISLESNVEEFFKVDNRLYVRNGMQILEVNFLNFNDNLKPTLKLVANILDVPGATKTFDGVIFQNMLGKIYISIFPKSGMCVQNKINEFDKLKILDAKYENKILVVLAVNKKGEYSRFILKYSDDFKNYEITQTSGIEQPNINFTVSEKGIVLFLNEKEEIEVFFNQYQNNKVQIMQDPFITGEMNLTHDGNKFMFYLKNELFSITSKA